jgi:16S rRNA (cytosine1402-N4)-methyltransferase
VPEYSHQPVLLAEVLEALRPRPGGRYADGTLGGGGHAAAILQTSSPTGWLYGCDRDGAALEAARARLAPYAGRFELRQGNFADLADWVPPASCHGVLFDLGVSSPQLDRPERGFSVKADGPLDMRMDPRGGPTAAEYVNGLDEAELARIFWELGGEPQGRRFAREIVRERRRARFETTGQLARFLERLAPRGGKKRHPATKVFMALRMAVNDEVRSLKNAMAAARTLLLPGGRLAIITFCSGEDRLVKEFGREQCRDYDVDGPVDDPALRRPRAPFMRWVSRRAIAPGEAELAANPRARSAQLRVLEKL